MIRIKVNNAQFNYQLSNKLEKQFEDAVANVGQIFKFTRIPKTNNQIN